MILLKRDFKQLLVLLIVGFVVLTGYVLAAKEAKAHRGAWQLSPRFATCEDIVNYLNLESIHEEFVVVPDAGGGYRIIFED
jgi:hypothetical protein